MHRLLASFAAVVAVASVWTARDAGVSAQGVPGTPQDPRRFGAIFVQCPGDTDGDSVPDSFNKDTNGDGRPDAYWVDENRDGVLDSPVRCMHLAASDGYVTMADQKPMYIFGFSDITGTRPADVMRAGELAANFPAPTIRLQQGEHFFLNLSNVGMVVRPDLFDPHSVHFHGFPQAAAVFDGVPESSLVVRMGSSFTYFYRIVEPGTYMYHCHVEATEHMQMGMLGNLYVEPSQNRLPNNSVLGAWVHRTGQKYAYNDRDGSTRYDVEYPIQIGSFDPNFHDQHEAVQPLPFAAMRDTYPMLNGRGYPDTTNPGVLSTNTDLGTKPSQPVHSLIEARAGQRVLLRISNLAVTRFYTLGSTVPMQVVGQSARLLRGPDPDGTGPQEGRNLYYTTNSVTLGGGESVDVIIDTTGLAGTYALYTTNLNYLSNDKQDFGGMMTEIRVR